MQKKKKARNEEDKQRMPSARDHPNTKKNELEFVFRMKSES